MNEQQNISFLKRSFLGMNNWLKIGGFDLVRSYRAVRFLPRFIRDMQAYESHGLTKFPLQKKMLHPILEDYKAEAGLARGHYFHQDLWAARKIFAARPTRHVDVGSRIDGFVAHLLTFMPVEVIDIRPLQSQVAGLTFIQEDATTLARFADNSLPSLSCLHAVEHFGLGRYGDPIDPTAWEKALRSLCRVLAPGGRLYFSVPVGRERVEFNAHRVFNPQTVLEVCHDLTLHSLSAVDDQGKFVEMAHPDTLATAEFACGLFEFTK